VEPGASFYFLCLFSYSIKSACVAAAFFKAWIDNVRCINGFADGDQFGPQRAACGGIALPPHITSAKSETFHVIVVHVEFGFERHPTRVSVP
jgi:hypothetical protein